MRRRILLQSLAAWSLAAATRATTKKAIAQPLGLVIHSYWIRGSKPLAPDFPPLNEPLAFVEVALKLGAAGVQTRIPAGQAALLERLREKVEQQAMYLEGSVALPKDDSDLARFEAELTAAKAAGASVVRTVCMSGRRYEVFTSRDQFDAFAKAAWKSLTLAEPLVARHKLRLAVENHKDWRTDEMLAWLKRLSSEFVGVCLDTGNSIALLEEPHAVVEALAPWTLSIHLKDMGVAEYEDGFLLSEVPLGTGFLDLPRIAATLRKARPEVRFNLEMITRDPLRIPCLKPAYFATLAEIPAAERAAAMARIRKAKSSTPLPSIGQLSHREQLEAEADNIHQSLVYAAKHLAP